MQTELNHVESKRVQAHAGVYLRFDLHADFQLTPVQRIDDATSTHRLWKFSDVAHSLTYGLRML